jgi:hypothetical protein
MTWLWRWFIEWLFRGDFGGAMNKSLRPKVAAKILLVLFITAAAIFAVYFIGAWANDFYHRYFASSEQQSLPATNSITTTLNGTNNGNFAGVNNGTQTVTVESAPPLFGYKPVATSTLENGAYHTQFVFETDYSLGDTRPRGIIPSSLFIGCNRIPFPCSTKVGRGGCATTTTVTMPIIKNPYFVGSPDMQLMECISVAPVTDTGNLFKLGQIIPQ